MLDLDALVGEMHGLAESVVQTARETAEKRKLARAQVEAARSMGVLRQAVADAGENMALPRANGDVGQVFPAPRSGDYTVIATDGSQVAPDYHHIAPWYVVNAGCAVFRYGTPPGRERCRLSSHPVLKPPRRPGMDPDGAPSDADALSAANTLPVQLEVERLKAELLLAVELLKTECDPGRTVLLLDGPLVQWRMLHEVRSKGDRDELIRIFGDLLRRARKTDTPVAGFISRSRAVEWVTLLRFSCCPDVPTHGWLCSDCAGSFLKPQAVPNRKAHHLALEGLRDLDVARMLLQGQTPGARTEIIELQSETWKKISGGSSTAGFFYVDTGSEIARVELPSWVWERRELLQRLHAVIWDQCEAGGGYPMVLSEAHEAAVVRGPDREAFYTLIERVLTERGVHEAMTSAKALSKRRPLA
jgi:hypothetical protein